MAKKSKHSNEAPTENLSISPSMAKPFGEALRFFRLKKRLTQEGLARSLSQYLETKIGQSYVSRIENGDFVPGHAQLGAIYEILKCNQETIWDKAEKFASAREADAIELDQQLLNVLGHKRLELSYESIKTIEKLLLRDDEKVLSVIAELKESIALPSESTDVRLISVEGMVKTSVVSGKATLELVEIIRFLVKQRDKLYELANATSTS